VGGDTGLLRTRFNTSEILVSLMLVYVSYHLLSYLVHGPMRDPAGFNFRSRKCSASRPPCRCWWKACA
jgi:ABC-type uncharacterized transport system permease subunit